MFQSCLYLHLSRNVYISEFLFFIFSYLDEYKHVFSKTFCLLFNIMMDKFLSCNEPCENGISTISLFYRSKNRTFRFSLAQIWDSIYQYILPLQNI